MNTCMERKWDPILKAAKGLFLAKGISMTSIDEVASVAGATKRTVYNNFGSKEGLVEAVFEQAAADIRASAPKLEATADRAALAHFGTWVLLSLTDEFAIGFQRLMIAENAQYSSINAALRDASMTALTQPLESLLASKGLAQTEASQTAEKLIALLTSDARLSRLLGMKPPYHIDSSSKDAPVLDAQDRLAVDGFVMACLSASTSRH
jgi:AcrR family transcriptional regulator